MPRKYDTAKLLRDITSYGLPANKELFNYIVLELAKEQANVVAILLLNYQTMREDNILDLLWGKSQLLECLSSERGSLERSSSSMDQLTDIIDDNTLKDPQCKDEAYSTIQSTVTCLSECTRLKESYEKKLKSPTADISIYEDLQSIEMIAAALITIAKNLSIILFVHNHTSEYLNTLLVHMPFTRTIDRYKKQNSFSYHDKSVHAYVQQHWMAKRLGKSWLMYAKILYPDLPIDAYVDVLQLPASAWKPKKSSVFFQLGQEYEAETNNSSTSSIRMFDSGNRYFSLMVILEALVLFPSVPRFLKDIVFKMMGASDFKEFLTQIVPFAQEHFVQWMRTTVKVHDIMANWISDQVFTIQQLKKLTTMFLKYSASTPNLQGNELFLRVFSKYIQKYHYPISINIKSGTFIHITYSFQMQPELIRRNQEKLFVKLQKRLQQLCCSCYKSKKMYQSTELKAKLMENVSSPRQQYITSGNPILSKPKSPTRRGTSPY